MSMVFYNYDINPNPERVIGISDTEAVLDGELDHFIEAELNLGKS